MQELVVHGENGWTYRADHLDGMKSAISSFLTTSESALNEMREKARASVSELTPESTADKILTLVEWVGSSG